MIYHVESGIDSHSYVTAKREKISERRI